MTQVKIFQADGINRIVAMEREINKWAALARVEILSVSITVEKSFLLAAVLYK